MDRKEFIKKASVGLLGLAACSQLPTEIEPKEKSETKLKKAPPRYPEDYHLVIDQNCVACGACVEWGEVHCPVTDAFREGDPLYWVDRNQCYMCIGFADEPECLKAYICWHDALKAVPNW
jgi:hypothetical protein